MSEPFIALISSAPVTRATGHHLERCPLFGCRGRGHALSPPSRGVLKSDENSRAELHLARTETLTLELVVEGFADVVRDAKRRDTEASRWCR